MSQSWKEGTFVAFDTETTGGYPLGSELCEVAAVKWEGGEIVDQFQSLIRPTHPMSDFIIGIHNITNEMVADAPKVSEVIPQFIEFIGDAPIVAHHAQFDLGFLAVAIEDAKLAFPRGEVLCSSILSRKLISGTENHKLQTLVKHLKIQQGQAHRALDDSIACLHVALNCFKRVGEDAPLAKILEVQDADLSWPRFSLKNLSTDSMRHQLIQLVREQEPFQIVYRGGSRPGQARTVYPIGIVRNIDGDYFIAKDSPTGQRKRYFLDKITNVNA